MMSPLASTNVVMKGLQNSAGSTLMALAARLDPARSVWPT